MNIKRIFDLTIYLLAPMYYSFLVNRTKNLKQQSIEKSIQGKWKLTGSLIVLIICIEKIINK